MRKSLLNEAGVVVSVVIADDKWTPENGLIVGPDGGEVGDVWDGAKYDRLPQHKEPPIEQDIRDEAQRRIILLVGAQDLSGCFIRQLNANMRVNELNDIRHERPLTLEEQAEANSLRSLASAIKSIRAASNAFGEKIPDDYRDDKYWPVLR